MIGFAPAFGVEPSLAHELGEQLAVVDDLVGAAEVRVLVRERVEAVRAAGDDLRHALLVQRRRRSARRTPGRRTRCPSGGPGRRCTPRAGRGSRSRRRPSAAASPSPPPTPARARRTRPRSRPSRGTPAADRRARARARRAPPPSPRARSAASPTGSPPARRRAASARPRPGTGVDHHAAAAEVDDVVDVLDRDRARLDARAAGDAVPDHLLGHSVADDRLVALGEAAGRGRP